MKDILNKIQKWIKSHKKLTTTIVVCLVILIAFIIAIKAVMNYLMPNTRKSVYGERCEITEKYPIESSKEKELKEFFAKYDYITFNSLDVKCNLIDIIITVPDSTNFNDVKTMSKELLKVFTENQIKYYDIELMVKSDKTESESYPQVGSHHKVINGSSNDSFVW